MATYLELFDLQNENDLLHRVGVAVVKHAQEILDKPTPTSAEVAWASQAVNNPRQTVRGAYHYLLAKHSDKTVDALKALTDSEVQQTVDAGIDAMIAGGIV